MLYWPEIEPNKMKLLSRLKSANSALNSRGQALIEFIFVFMLFNVMVFAAIQLSLVANAKSMLNLATYAACREYAVTYSKNKARLAASVQLKPIMNELDPLMGYFRVNFKPDNDPGFGKKVQTTVTVFYKPMPLVKKLYPLVFGGRSVKLKSSCSMTME